jgi:hypothetical protein
MREFVHTSRPNHLWTLFDKENENNGDETAPAFTLKVIMSTAGKTVNIFLLGGR